MDVNQRTKILSTIAKFYTSSSSRYLTSSCVEIIYTRPRPRKRPREGLLRIQPRWSTKAPYRPVEKTNGFNDLELTTLVAQGKRECCIQTKARIKCRVFDNTALFICILDLLNTCFVLLKVRWINFRSGMLFQWYAHSWSLVNRTRMYIFFAVTEIVNCYKMPFPPIHVP